MCYAFVRSSMEYGCLQYLGAADSHLSKLDRIQRRAERICQYQFTSLSRRRHAALYGFTCKLLDGRGRGELQNYMPELREGIRLPNSRETNNLGLISLRSSTSLKKFDISIQGQMDAVFNKMPQKLLREGFEKNNWTKTIKRGQKYIMKC